MLQFRDVLQPGVLSAGSLTNDVSAGGLKFGAAQFIAPQRRLLLQLTLPGSPIPIRTVARVLWTYKQPHSDAYQIGTQFVEINPQDRGTLADYVERGVHAPLDAPLPVPLPTPLSAAS